MCSAVFTCAHRRPPVALRATLLWRQRSSSSRRSGDRSDATTPLPRFTHPTHSYDLSIHAHRDLPWRVHGREFRGPDAAARAGARRTEQRRVGHPAGDAAVDRRVRSRWADRQLHMAGRHDERVQRRHRRRIHRRAQRRSHPDLRAAERPANGTAAAAASEFSVRVSFTPSNTLRLQSPTATCSRFRRSLLAAVRTSPGRCAPTTPERQP